MLIRNTLFLSAAQVSGRVVRFLYMLAIARLLGPEETGVYLYGVALYLGVIGIGQFGQDIFLSQRVGKHGGTPFPVLHHSLTLTLLATLTVTGGLALFVWASEPEPGIRLVIMCFVGAMVARLVASWVRVAYVAFEQTAWIPRYEVTFRGLEALIGTGVLFAGGGLLAVSFLHFLFWSIETGFSLNKIAREHPGALGLRARPGYLKKIIGVSVVFLTGTTAMMLFPQIAVILMRKMQPDQALIGQFGIAMQFMTTLMIIPIAAAQAFLPRLSRSFSRGGDGRDLITAVKLVGLMALASAVAAAAYGPWFITLVLGPEYAEAAELFRWLCWVFTPYATAVFLCQCFNVIGGRGKAAIILVSMTAIHAGLLVAYIGQSPAVAAVASMAVAAIAGMIVALFQVSSMLAGRGHSWWLKSVLVVVAAYAIFESDWAPLMLTAPVALVVAGVLTWLLRVFDADDIAAIRRLLGRPAPGV